MRKNYATLVLSVALAASAQAQTAGTQTANNAQPPAASLPPAGNVSLPTKMAIIYVQEAIANSKEGAAGLATLQTKYQPRKDAFDKRQRDIQAQTDQLKKGGATMSDDARQKLGRDVDSKTKELQRDMQDANDDYQQDMGKVFQEVGNKMLQIIEQYSYQNGYAAVLDVSNQQTPVIWAAPSTNITPDIVKLYDQAHPVAAVAPAAKPSPLPKPPAEPPIKK